MDLRVVGWECVDCVAWDGQKLLSVLYMMVNLRVTKDAGSFSPRCRSNKPFCRDSVRWRWLGCIGWLEFD